MRRNFSAWSGVGLQSSGLVFPSSPRQKDVLDEPTSSGGIVKPTSGAGSSIASIADGAAVGGSSAGSEHLLEPHAERERTAQRRMTALERLIAGSRVLLSLPARGSPTGRARAGLRGRTPRGRRHRGGS